MSVDDEEPIRLRRLLGGLRGPTGWFVVAVLGMLAMTLGVVFGLSHDDTSADAQPAVSPVASASALATLENSPSPVPTPGVSRSPSRTASATPTAGVSRTPNASSAARPVTFTGYAGYTCPSSATAGFRQVGRFTHDDKYTGWYSVGTGGLSKCGGGYDAMPMSGDAAKDDPSFYAEWYFVVGSATKTCDLSAYVPTADDTDAGRAGIAGSPAFYEVRDSEGGAVKSTFTIQQWANRGRWVAVGTVPVSGGRVVIRSLNRGVDWKTPPYLLHIAVAQFSVSCH
ncbi:hypothetical protein AB0M47_03730 [Hamadaea sp. NPDC051192]|uniref:hypothetical protein n=1 Tax=Hamadaea sp. NPDC051192 TaxID=3154940 RepID=UPI00342165CB